MDLSIFRLENYWLPIIWLFVFSIIAFMMPKKHELVLGAVKKRWYWFTVCIMLIPFIIWGGTRSWIGDTAAYARYFNKCPSSFSLLPAYIATLESDVFFYAFMAFLKCMGIATSQGYFLVMVAIQFLLMSIVFRKYSDHYWICIFLFIASTDYISWVFNGMRQFTAVCITFAAFGFLVKKQFLQFSLVVLLASTVHASAILMIPMGYIMLGPALNRKTLLTILATALLIPFIDRFLPFLGALLEDTQYNDIMSNGIWESDDGTNIIRVFVYSVPALLALFGRRYILRENDPVINLCVNASVLTMAVYLISSVTSGIYIGRIPIYTTLHGYIILPRMIDCIFEKSTASLIKLLMIVFYIAFYYYQMGMTWGLL